MCLFSFFPPYLEDGRQGRRVVTCVLLWCVCHGGVCLSQLTSSNPSFFPLLGDEMWPRRKRFLDFIWRGRLFIYSSFFPHFFRAFEEEKPRRFHWIPFTCLPWWVARLQVCLFPLFLFALMTKKMRWIWFVFLLRVVNDKVVIKLKAAPSLPPCPNDERWRRLECFLPRDSCDKAFIDYNRLTYLSLLIWRERST